MKENSATDLDVLYSRLKEEGKLSIEEIASYFNISEDLAMAWSKTLESGELAKISVPRFGKPMVLLNVSGESEIKDKKSIVMNGKDSGKQKLDYELEEVKEEIKKINPLDKKKQDIQKIIKKLDKKEEKSIEKLPEKEEESEEENEGVLGKGIEPKPLPNKKEDIFKEIEEMRKKLREKQEVPSKDNFEVKTTEKIENEENKNTENLDKTSSVEDTNRKKMEDAKNFVSNLRGNGHDDMFIEKLFLEKGWPEEVIKEILK